MQLKKEKKKKVFNTSSKLNNYFPPNRRSESYTHTYIHTYVCNLSKSTNHGTDFKWSV